MRALTVGHSTHSLEDFLGLLDGAGVRALADVRRFPGSRRHPHFGREALERALRDAGVRYEHLPQLGGRRSPAPASPNGGWRVAAFRGYADHLRSEEFAAGMARLEELAGSSRGGPEAADERAGDGPQAADVCARGEPPAGLLAVMCAEAQWWRCHRRLIADVLVLAGNEVDHLMPDGRLIAHQPPPFAARGADGLPVYPPM